MLLPKVDDAYLHRFDAILVSIDGKRTTTNHYRGEGTYEQVVKNIRLIRTRGFTGDLIARMTVSAQSDIYADVRHLLMLKLFDHIHWQLDFFWSASGTWKNQDQWLQDNYLPEITRLVREWISQMKTAHIVQGIVPFQGIMHTLLTGQRTRLRCDSGLDFFAITPSGEIYACPITIGIEDFLVGDILNTKPSEIFEPKKIIDSCHSCDIYDICGGALSLCKVLKALGYCMCTEDLWYREPSGPRASKDPIPG